MGGDDAQTFLQGQFGNDVNQLDECHHQLNCYSNPKGRLLAVFRLFRHGGYFYLRMPREIIDATLMRLKMFVLMAKVSIEDISDSFACIGVKGSDASQALAGIFAETPEETNSMRVDNDIAVLRVPGLQARYEVYGDRGNLESVVSALKQSGEEIDDRNWAYDDILAGVPTVFTATREEFVAQMVNLQLIDGLSFKKGCYPGQEIVARMHYLGKLKRRMYLLRLDGAEVPAAGTDVYAEGSDSATGKIVDACAIDDKPVRALAVLNIATAESQALFVGGPGGQAVTIETLPYAFEAHQQD